MIDIEERPDAVELFVHEPGRKLLVAAHQRPWLRRRRGRSARHDAQRQAGAERRRRARRPCVCAPVDGDSVAVIGDNRKLLLFPLSELPEMPRGKGVRLQRYKDGGLADVKAFTKKDGLTYIDSAKRSFTLTATELARLVGPARPSRTPPPKGFPKSKFGPQFGAALSLHLPALPEPSSTRTQPLEVRRSCGSKRFL